MSDPLYAKIPILGNTASGSFATLIFCFLILVIFSTPILAELASPDEMEMVCINWLTYIVSQTGDWAGDTSPEIIAVQEIIDNDTLLARYYAISSGGYIIVPVLKELAPVKAYSENSTLDISESGGFAIMLREVIASRMRIFAEVYGSLEVSQPNSGSPLFDYISRQKWDKFAVDSYQFAADKNPAEPLTEAGPLLTTAWHQSAPYNNLCPDGDGDRCVVGCVATAAAQIVWYYEWPPYGAGSHSYYWQGDLSCEDSTPGQTLYADYSDPYYYDGSHDALAELCYEMGVAYEMNYGACASGAWTMQGAWIYPTYFRYLDTTSTQYRDEHTASSWFELIKAEINMRRPILYQIPRHAIVCDGWRVADELDQYHFNYGWGGSQNIWYTVDNLHCPWAGCDPMYEVMLTRIIPDKGIPWLRNDGISDEFSGNNNSVYEPGETVEMSFTVINYGGASLNDVTVTLTTDEASLIIGNGSVFIGGINPFDSVTNSGNPFTIEIPADYIPRIDSFFMAISWNGGLGADTVIVEQAIGTPAILLVDYGNSNNVTQIYVQSFSSLRIPYDIFDAAISSPDAADLSQYDIVFWYSGNYRPDPLSSIEISAMKGYLDSGGSLFLNGQAIAAQLSTLDPDFLNNYLKSAYQATMSIAEIPILTGEPGLICDTSDIIAIVSGSGAGNQEYPDLIDSINGGIPELKYIAQEYLGGITYSGEYNLIFFSFGFEAIINGDYRWTDRDILFQEILEFFNCQSPDALPQVTALTISPGDPMHLLDHTPNFKWIYEDASESPQSMYHLQVGLDYDWSEAEIWEVGPSAGDDTLIVYSGPPLEDGENYHIRVRVHNGTLWSDWHEGQLRFNSAPGMTVPISPTTMQAVININPELTHTNAIDDEYDIITYAYEVYGDPQMLTLIESADNQPEGQGETTIWQVSAVLSEDQEYYWRLRAYDSYEYGPWSDLAGFWINAVNQMPAPFDLLTPEDEAIIEYTNPMFTWTPSFDNDLHDQVGYTLLYSADSTFAEFTAVAGLDTTYFIPPASLPPAAAYYWKVTAADLFEGETVSNQMFSFSFLVAGDANGDGRADVADAVFLINFVFKGGPTPDPYLSGDANCDMIVDVGDAVYIIGYIFRGGPEPGCM